MKKILFSLLVVVIQGCAHGPVTKTPDRIRSCIGTLDIDSQKFEPATDDVLLSQTLGEPLQGKLCQGKVFKSKTRVTVYRAWNSTNPGSEFGRWWALKQPSGLTSAYRKNYEICYQWSPLDKLEKCTLKAGTKVVIGNGQSAKCSEYLTYPVSEKQQLFIPDAANSVADCQEYDSVIRWE